MPRAFKPLSSQVVVITGASSGIGLATAREASARGAKLLLVSRNAQALRTLCEELKAKGGVADFVVADVADVSALEEVARRADSLYGGFDTWVNNAGVSIFGTIGETPLEDQRRLFDTNYWGVVNGSRVAVEHLKDRPDGGVLINIGSVLSDQAIPVQGVYSASKHAVKGFTNALRMELMASAPRVSVTLIKPSAIDTPYHRHAKSYLGEKRNNPPPVYSVTLVADAILYAAENRTREITVGGGGRLQATIGQAFPHLAEPMFAWVVPLLMRSGGQAAAGTQEALYSPASDGQESTPYLGVRQTSLWTAAQMNPRTTLSIVSGSLATLLVLHKLHRALQLAGARRSAVRRYRDRLEARAERAAQREG